MFASIRKTVLATVAAATVLGATSIAQAGQEFSILNETGVDLYEAYITPQTVDNWGRNMLDDSVFADGNTANVEMTGFGDACVYDLLFVDAHGTEFDYRGVDVCTYSDLIIR